ncbi:ankyrin, partial [Thozetella sp. PMI_491]
IPNAPDVNATDSSGNAPLHLAARYGHCDVAQVLLGKGANMRLQTGDNKSLLEIAIVNERKVMVQLLLEKGAD